MSITRKTFDTPTLAAEGSGQTLFSSGTETVRTTQLSPAQGYIAWSTGSFFFAGTTGSGNLVKGTTTPYWPANTILPFTVKSPNMWLAIAPSGSSGATIFVVQVGSKL